MVSPPGDPACWWSTDRHARHRVETREGGVDRVNGNGEHSALPPEAADSATEPLHLADRLALRPEEAAQALGLSERKLRDILPELPHFRVGKAVLLPVEALRAWVQEQTKVEPGRVDAVVKEIMESITPAGGD